MRGEAGGSVVLQILQGPRVMSDEGEGGRMRQVLSLLAFLVKSATADTLDCLPLAVTVPSRLRAAKASHNNEAQATPRP